MAKSVGELVRPTELRLAALFEHAPDLVFLIDGLGRVLFANPACADLIGRPIEQLIDVNVLDIVHPDDHGRAVQALIETRANGPGRREPIALRVLTADATIRTLEIVANNLLDNVAVGGVLIFGRDVTEQHGANHRVDQLLEVLESSAELVIFTDSLGVIEYVNTRAREVLGIAEGDDPRGELARYLTPASVVTVTNQLVPHIQEHGLWMGELAFCSSAGEEIPVAATVQFHRDELGELRLVSAIAHDIRELKDFQRLLEHQATHDPLTALPNRTLFQALGEQALARANRDGTTVAVLFLDLDNFKHVNDTHGHHIGDELLKEIATRLRGSVRKGDVLARFGGDEFAVACEHPAGEPEMRELALRLISAVSPPVEIEGTSVRVGVSVGIAIGAGSRMSIDALLRDSDVALYRAKEQGRGRAVVFGDSSG